MTRHFGLARRTDSSGWLTLAKDETWEVLDIATTTLQPVVDASLDKLRATPTADFSFSNTRDGNALIADALEEQPTADALRTMWPGKSITVLCPIAGPVDYADHWCHVWRDPRGGLTTNGRFIARLVPDEIQRWLAFYDVQKVEKRVSGALELIVRHGWSAAKLLPEAFPASKPPPARTPEQLSKAERDAKVRRIVKQHRSMRESQGFRYSPRSRAYRPPAE